MTRIRISRKRPDRLAIEHEDDLDLADTVTIECGNCCSDVATVTAEFGWMEIETHALVWMRQEDEPYPGKRFP